MNNQLLFDRVADHLLTQMACSTGESGCMYRGDCDRKCAVGALIEDQYYYEGLESNSPFDDGVRQALEKSLGESLTEDNIELLQLLQEVHDMNDPEEWEDRLRDFAEGRGLNFEIRKSA